MGTAGSSAAGAAAPPHAASIITANTVNETNMVRRVFMISSEDITSLSGQFSEHNQILYIPFIALNQEKINHKF